MVKGKWSFIALILLFTVPLVLYAGGEGPKQVLEEFNASLTVDEAMPYLTGFMKTQFTALSSTLSEQKQEKFMKSLCMKSYDTKIIPIDDNLEFIMVNNIVMSNGSKPLDGELAYEFDLKDGQWKIQNRLSAGMIMFGLLKEHFSPDQFNVQNSFAFDGSKVVMESAFAYIQKEKNNKKSLIIKFYPFPFQERDIEFLKYSFGAQVKDTDKPTSLASSIFNYPQSVMNIYLDENDQIISFSQNLSGFKGSMVTNAFDIQPAVLSPYIQQFTIKQGYLSLISKGSYQTQPYNKEISWDININLPLIKKDID